MVFLLSRWGNQDRKEEMWCLAFSSSWGKHFIEWAIFPALGISSINARPCVFKKHTVDDVPKCSTSHSTAVIKHVDQTLLKGGVSLFGLHFQVIVHHRGKPWQELQARAQKQPCLLFHIALLLTRVSLTTTAAQRTIMREDFLLAHCHANALLIFYTSQGNLPREWYLPQRTGSFHTN